MNGPTLMGLYHELFKNQFSRKCLEFNVRVIGEAGVEKSSFVSSITPCYVADQLKSGEIERILYQHESCLKSLVLKRNLIEKVVSSLLTQVKF